MARLLRPTLGPTPRMVAITRLLSSDPPEVLDHAATIARRTLQLADPFEDMGAMLVRHLVWRVFERTGDGTATAAVLAQAIVARAMRYVAAGGDAVAVRRGIQCGLPVALAALRAQARPIDSPEEIAASIQGSLGNASLAEDIGRIVDAVGADGSIVVESANGTRTGYEYFDGMRWEEGYVSSFLLREGETTLSVLNPRVFVTTYPLERAEHVLPALEACIARGDRGLFVVAPEVRDSAIGLLALNRARGVLDGAIAVRAPSYGDARTRILEDLAIATGARCVDRDRGDGLSNITADDLGTARQAWATRSAFAVVGGHGDPAAVRDRIADAKGELASLVDDEVAQVRVRERIGKLAGTAAAIRVGAPSQTEQEELKVRVEIAVRSARAALRGGVVAGGGAALIGCMPRLEVLAATLPGDEAVGVRLLARALTSPMTAIVRNAGLEPGPVVAEACQRGLPWLFDTVEQRWCDAWDSGITDPFEVVQTALEVAASAAGSAITADVLVRRRHEPAAFTP